MLEELGISNEDALFRMLVVENGQILRGGLAVARALQGMGSSWWAWIVGNLYGSFCLFPGKAFRGIMYNYVSESRQLGPRNSWVIGALNWFWWHCSELTAETTYERYATRMLGGGSISMGSPLDNGAIDDIRRSTI